MLSESLRSREALSCRRQAFDLANRVRNVFLEDEFDDRAFFCLVEAVKRLEDVSPHRRDKFTIYSLAFSPIEGERLLDKVLCVIQEFEFDRNEAEFMLMSIFDDLDRFRDDLARIFDQPAEDDIVASAREKVAEAVSPDDASDEHVVVAPETPPEEPPKEPPFWHQVFASQSDGGRWGVDDLVLNLGVYEDFDGGQRPDFYDEENWAVDPGELSDRRIAMLEFNRCMVDSRSQNWFAVMDGSPFTTLEPLRDLPPNRHLQGSVLLQKAPASGGGRRRSHQRDASLTRGRRGSRDIYS